MKVLITSGGTNVKIDDVRHIGNMSSGMFASKITSAMLDYSDSSVDFLMAKGSRSPFEMRVDYLKQELNGFNGIDTVSQVLEWIRFCERNKGCFRNFVYDSFESYQEQLECLLKHNQYDIVVLAAAVSDYGVENPVGGKIRSGEQMNIKLKPYPKLISNIKKISSKSKLVGFKLLSNSTVEELIAAAKKSIIDNDCDMVVANDLTDIKNGNHRVYLVQKDFSYRTFHEKGMVENTLAQQVANYICSLK